MKITDRCSEYIAGMVAGVGAVAATAASSAGTAGAGAGAAALMTTGLPAIIGAGTLIGFWVTGKLRHSVESKRALRKIRRSIQRDWRKDPAFSSVGQNQIEAAAKALEAHLPKVMLSQQELAQAAIDRERRPFPEAATLIVLDALEDQDSMFAEGEIAHDFAKQVVTTAFEEAIKDEHYFKAFERHLLVELAGYIGKAANDVEILRADFDAYKELQTERHDALLENFQDVKAKLDATGTTLPQSIVDQLAEVRSDDETLEQQIQSLIAQYQAAQSAADEGLKPSNNDAFVDEVLRRVSEKLLAGDAEAADEEVRAAFAQWESEEEERQKAEQRNGVKLLEKASQTAYILGRAEAVAETEWKRITLSTSGEPERTEALRARQDVYDNRGQRMGVRLDLNIAIKLSRIGIKTAPNDEIRATHQNDLTIVIGVLGERTGGDAGLAYLEDALAGYDAALEIYTKESAAADWAMTQQNRASVLQVLGERTGGDAGLAYLENALAGYDAALEVRTKESAAADWAMTQQNRASVLELLGGRTGGDAGLAYLENALAGYDAALEVRTKESAAADWAMTQQNRASVLQVLGERTGGDAGLAYLENALAGYDAALEVRTKESAAADWAMTQQNRASVLELLGGRTGGDAGLAYLEDALAGYDAALEVYTKESAAADWAMTQQNRAIVLQVLGERTGGDAGLAYLEDALAGYDAALEIYTKESAAADWAMTKENIAILHVSRFEITSEVDDLVAAEAAAAEAMSIYQDGGMEFYAEKCQRLLNQIATLKAGGSSSDPTPG